VGIKILDFSLTEYQKSEYTFYRLILHAAVQSGNGLEGPKSDWWLFSSPALPSLVMIAKMIISDSLLSFEA
jgi:hypothetical protein